VRRPIARVSLVLTLSFRRVKRKAATPGGSKRKARGPKGMVENPVCGHCGTKNTPEWRSGPNGMLLCNACGLKWSRKRQKPGNP
jgi:hypothetical protein